MNTQSPSRKPWRSLITAAIIFTILVVAVLLVFQWQTRKQPQKVLIGFVGGLTGRVADLGTAGRNGAILAIEEQNAMGGVSGNPLELVIRDDMQDAATAREVTQELLDMGVTAIIGPMTSSVAMAIVPLTEKAGVPVISPTVTTQQLLGKDDNFIRVCSSTREYAIHAAQFHVSELGFVKTSVFLDEGNLAYTQDWLECYQAEFETLGGEIQAVKRFTSGENVLFEDAAIELLNSSLDNVLLICNAVDAAHIANQIRKRDGEIQLTMAEWASTERLIELGGRNVEGAYVAQFIDRDSTASAYLAFVADYQNRFGGDPGFAGVSAYDSAKLMISGLQIQRKEETLTSAILRTGTIEGLQQDITLDEYGDSHRPTMISQIRDGQYRIME